MADDDLTFTEEIEALPRYCPGGRGKMPVEGMSACPTCGSLFHTVVDEPDFPPHLLWPSGSVTFGVERS